MVNKNIKIILLTVFIFFFLFEMFLIDDYKIIYDSGLPVAIIFAVWILLFPYIIVKNNKYLSSIKLNNEEDNQKVKTERLLSKIFNIFVLIILIILIIIKITHS